jgi:hypothetical protein
MSYYVSLMIEKNMGEVEEHYSDFFTRELDAMQFFFIANLFIKHLSRDYGDATIKLMRFCGTEWVVQESVTMTREDRK